MKAVILAGGLGTRLRAVVSDVPKPMAPVAGRPFLDILILNLRSKGVTEVVLSVGYQHEKILMYFGNNYKGVKISYVIEDSPLGTGGALIKALELFGHDEDVIVVNGDTFLDVDLNLMKQEYANSGADIGIALQLMGDTHRYGRVALDENNRVSGFEEKGVHQSGLINAGVYILRPSFFDQFDLPVKFSLENDCFVEHLTEIEFFPFIVDSYFIDIGVPEDYRRAQTELLSF